MRSVGIRELKNGLSRYLRRLKAGETMAITDRGRVVAELRAPTAEGTSPLTGHYERLVERGVIRRARERGDPMASWPTSRTVKLAPGTAAALVEEDRAE